ncbi:subunit Rpc1 of DNA-directed RNA polymerase III, partial [Hamiltosporidium tvaerminnensis]
MKKTLSSYNTTSTKIKEIKFKIFSTDQINRLSVLKLTKKEMYDSTTKQPMPNGVLDTRLGISNKTGTCSTCNQSIKDCAGHFGSYELILPVFHIGFFKHTCHILQCICKNCGNILLSPLKKHFYTQKVQSLRNNIIFYKNILKKIMEECKKFHKCYICEYINGNIKKGTGFKLYHEKNVIFKDLEGNSSYRDVNNLLSTRDNSYGNNSYGNNSLSMSRNNSDKIVNNKLSTRDNSYVNNSLENNILETNSLQKNKTLKTTNNSLKTTNTKEKIKEELNPQTVLNLFKKIPLSDTNLLGISFPPKDLLIQTILIPPACIRPSVATETENGSNEDDLTVKLSEIIHTNQVLIKGLQKGNQLSIISEDWDFLQLQVSLLINSDLPGISNNTQIKPIRGLIQRLKGKHGRFRGNLSGKRVDFTGRTVISPDPNLSIEQVGIPIQMAKTLTIPETVTKYNIQHLKSLIIKGPHTHPGANYIYNKKTEFKRFLQYGDRKKISENIFPGDIVERHLQNGDIVLFNRQPSLHRLSIMAHHVKVMPYKTLRFNECVCTPYNADFDGDEMNIHVPQTLEAQSEAHTLMRVRNNIVTPRNGEPLVAATQDFITASYLLTSKDRFFTKQRFSQLICYFLGVDICNTRDIGSSSNKGNTRDISNTRDIGSRDSS